MARGWIFINDNTERSEEEIDRIAPLLNDLAAQWSQLHDTAERQHAAQVEVIEDERYMQCMECDRFGESCY